MSDSSPSLINAAQTRALAQWSHGIARAVRLRGAELVRARAVQRIWWTKPGRELRALVKGGRLYSLSIQLDPTGLTGVPCTCPFGEGCKHAAALVEEILQGHAVDGAPAGAGAPAAPAPTPAPVGLAAEISALTGQKLGPKDLLRAEEIEALLASGRNVLHNARLLELAGMSGYGFGWRDGEVAIWPAPRPPANALEAWLYVAHAVRTMNRSKPAGLFAKVPWERVDALVAPWVREQEIERWHAELAAVAAAPDPRLIHARFRLRLNPRGGTVEWKPPLEANFTRLSAKTFREYLHANRFSGMRGTPPPLDEIGRRFCTLFDPSQYLAETELLASQSHFPAILNGLLRVPGFEESVVTPQGEVLPRAAEPLRWALSGPHFPASALIGENAEPAEFDADYVLRLCLPDGTSPPPALVVLAGDPILHVTPERVFAFPPGGMGSRAVTGQPMRIPAAALASAAGLAALDRLGVPAPPRIQARRITKVPTVTVRARLWRYPQTESEYFQLTAQTTFDAATASEHWTGSHWTARDLPAGPSDLAPAGEIVHWDRALPQATLVWLAEQGVKGSMYSHAAPARERWLEKRLAPATAKAFPEEFLAWLERRPEGVVVELDPELASLQGNKVSGELRFEAEESGEDWFDLRLALAVTDVELTPGEIEALLRAPGRWVRLPGKGWRRLEFQLSEEQQRELADLGLSPADLASGEPQRLHVFQLASPAASRLLPEAQVEHVRRRAADLQTRVTPELPAALTAELRPYQREGFHFLAYLTSNRFGGILADDMGLGKTVQALAWLGWLRENGRLPGTVLVVCPKSVQDNWRAEAVKFFPSLPVHVWNAGNAGEFDPTAAPGLLVINYVQLRLYAASLEGRAWSAVILDEAQYIKNPTSATARAACALRAPERLALSGTPIENRLLDLWSIMAFAMPGVLGNRTAFTRNFGGKDDPLARRRLAARMRPFLLRRTKREVAKDLPERIEEDIVCELEGTQATLYRAELKRARTMLLKAKTARQLDHLRFHILTSLLRLRQICCHPSLVGSGTPADDSAKLGALFELLEPLLEEGQKVLVFSQFVGVLDLVRARLEERAWPHLILTGQTQDRGALVADFQAREGGCVFLISLKAGGFGLNLTAASYVVLFDPWWNPAVENQAIDRTHRIGQTQTVIAYRLLMRDSIEEKIRALQRKKSALAGDILGEEGFAKALTLADFQFLFE